ncbi:leucine-rich repeat domain-containing protein [endosymbiont GvMRE of Glomus versiforme]|uniref:leucine-rich repeat domain-containing protein n=1 Tax=endosymbiont GvMRE of Glomus versiforme TaxID=2039283 RepID=UPI0015588416|nr:leucine-rich repeat domain-containing protein [endosymbiont GvMRE of Glomus versiforme]
MANYLKRNKYNSKQELDLVKLRKEHQNNLDWKDVHKGFEYHQNKWEVKNFTYQETKQWINIGLTPYDYEFAFYLKKNNYQPPVADLETAKKEYYQAQVYLDFWYPKNGTCLRKSREYNLNYFDKIQSEKNKFNNFGKTREQITVLGISHKNIHGSLNLEGFGNLEKLNCDNNKLTNLNFLNNLNAEKLTELYIDNNNIIIDLTPFSKFTNLKGLGLSENKFTGSLKPLKNVSKLKTLDITDTDIDSGLGYLPDSIEKFYCSVYREDAKVKVIEEFWKRFKGDLKKCKEFNSPAWEWLDKNYPEDERGKIEYLNISNQNLEGKLRLEGFINLRKLDCSNNKLIDLDSSNCPNLIELKCGNNEFKDLSFLSLLDKLKLKRLSVQNNQNLSNNSLIYLFLLTNLEKLDISDCPLKGSLKILERLN